MSLVPTPSARNDPSATAAGNAPAVLIMADWYVPGYKGGGPIRTLVNMGDRLGSELRIRVVTRDRDFGDSQPYPGITPTGWDMVGNVRVAYRHSSRLTPWALRSLIGESPYDALYLNSCFSPAFTILPLVLRWLGLIPDARTILAPRGELATAALAHKWLKKRVYLALAKAVGLYRDITWQASSEAEAEEIRREFGEGTAVVVAPDMAGEQCEPSPPERSRVKAPGALRMVYLSRLVRKKNLDGALRMLRTVRGQVELDIFGPREDAEYWEECERIIETLPANVTVAYRGALPREDVPSVLAEYDLLFFPTLSENFGHVVLEALLAGIPVLISDTTPWRGLRESGAGWDVPLHRPDLFRQALETCLAWAEHEWQEARAAAWEMGMEYAANSDVLSRNLHLLRGHGALAAGGARG